MANAIKYQDTKVEVEKTLSELTALIKRYGGTRFEQNWTPEGRVCDVRCAIHHDSLGELQVRLVARTGRIQRILARCRTLEVLPEDGAREQDSGAG